MHRHPQDRKWVAAHRFGPQAGPPERLTSEDEQSATSREAGARARTGGDRAAHFRARPGRREPGGIARELSVDDVPSLTGGGWNRTTVRNIMENPAYAGEG
jgi:hypothetical protein